MKKIISSFVYIFLINLLITNPIFASNENDKYLCKPKHAAAIRANGIKVFEITGKEKPIYISIREGYLVTQDMSYKLYEAGGRAFAFNEEKAWVHFQDIVVLDNDELSFVMAVNSSIARYICSKE